MQGQLLRSWAIFRLALTFLWDYWRVRRIEKKYDGVRKEEALARVYAGSGARVRRAALRLQGLIVKVGQFLSTRSDMLPAAFTRELTQLQDAVPGAPYTLVQKELEASLGASVETLFQEFEKSPIAAASLGQVHRATLQDGQVVAVKLQRPGIERLAKIDLSALNRVVHLVYKFTRFGKRMNLPAIFREFEAMVQQELDYRVEAENLRRFRREYASDARLVIPAAMDEYVTKRVFIMEYIDGKRITDLHWYDVYHVDKTIVAEFLVEFYLQQLLVKGFIHADPHPGNLMLLEDGRLGVVDFGMMAEVPKTDVQNFSRLVQAALVRDFETVVTAIDNLGFLQPYADKTFLKKAVAMIINRIGGLELRKGPDLDVFLDEFEDFIHEEPIIIQAKYMFLGRALGILTGVVSTLNPNIQWTDVLKEKALPLLGTGNAGTSEEQTGWRGFVKNTVSSLFGENAGTASTLILGQLTETAVSLLKSPVSLERVLKTIDSGELKVRLEMDEVISRLDKQQRQFRRGMWLIVAIASVFAGIWLKADSFVWQSNVAFAITALSLIVSMMPTGSKTKQVRRHPGRRRR